MTPAGSVDTGSGYGLFGQPQFRKLWSANLVHYLCMVMLLLGVSWTMTSLTDNPLLVSMVQTMTSLPFILFGIPIGLATDRLGHRTVMLASQFWMLGVTGLMAVIALSGGWDFTPLLLLAMLFLLGVGVVAQQSAWKPFLHDVVPKDGLVAAISFNSLSSDAGRAVGPVIGGYLMGFFGTAVVLVTSTVSQLMMILAIKTTPSADRAAMAGATRTLREGWDHLRRSPGLYGPMVRCALVMAPCGGVLGLLPLEAKENIQTGPIGYGGLLAAMGIGSAAGGALTPILRRHIPFGVLSAVCVAVFSLAVIGISQWDSMALDAGFLFLFGITWSMLSIAHQFAVQIGAPEAMRGLMMSFYALVLQGSMAAGSFAFGLLAGQVGVSRAILLSGLIAMSGLLLVRRYPIPVSAA